MRPEYVLLGLRATHREALRHGWATMLPQGQASRSGSEWSLRLSAVFLLVPRALLLASNGLVLGPSAIVAILSASHGRKLRGVFSSRASLIRSAQVLFRSRRKRQDQSDRTQ